MTDPTTALPAPGPSRVGRIVRHAWQVSAVPVASVLLAIIVGGLVILASSIVISGSLDLSLPFVAYGALLEGGLGIGAPDAEATLNALTRSMVATAPLLLAGLSVALGIKAGLFNIGATGQFVIGGLAASVVGAAVSPLGPWLAIPIAVVAGAAAGAAYGFIPGALKAITGAHEVVTTIMLNYIAVLTATALVIGPLRAPGYTFDRTADVGNAGLPVLLGRDLHLGVLIALAFAPLYGWLVWRSTLGFEIRTVGANPSAARYAGMSPRRLIMVTMSLCGMLAGLAGTIVFLGQVRYYPATFGTGIGFEAIAVALLGRSHPAGVLLAAFLFGVLRAGAPLMQIRADIPIQIIDVLQAIILFFLAADIIVRRLFRFRAARSGMESDVGAASRSYGGEAGS